MAVRLCVGTTSSSSRLVKDFELHVSTFGNADQESGTREFVGAIVTGYHPIHYRVAPPPSKLVRILVSRGAMAILARIRGARVL